jgi:hypothetical protein
VSTNVGTEATKGVVILRTTKTYTFTYGPNMYGSTQLPQEADLVVEPILGFGGGSGARSHGYTDSRRRWAAT